MSPAAVGSRARGRGRSHLVPLMVLAAACLGLLYWTSRPTATLVDWRRDLAAAQQEAREENRLVLLEFDMVGCGYCRLMDGEVFSRPEVLPLLEGFVPVRLDMNRHGREARRFGVRAAPSFYVLTPAGETIASLEAAWSFQDFSRFLSSVQAEHRSSAP